METELGKIANLAGQQDSDTSPLQKELTHMSKIVSVGIIVLGVILFFVARQIGMGVHEGFIFALGVAVSIMPQGLPAQINTALALASARLAKNNVLLKKLSSAETMGSTSMICTDKTGTLTKNEMTIEEILIGNTTYKVTGIGYEPNGFLTNSDGTKANETVLNSLKLFFQAGIFASNAKINPPDNEHQTRYCLGDPTEGAVITL